MTSGVISFSGPSPRLSDEALQLQRTVRPSAPNHYSSPSQRRCPGSRLLNMMQFRRRPRGGTSFGLDRFSQLPLQRLERVRGVVHVTDLKRESEERVTVMYAHELSQAWVT